MKEHPHNPGKISLKVNERKINYSFVSTNGSHRTQVFIFKIYHWLIPSQQF